MKRVLVTGAGGYIGSVLVPLLVKKGYSVVAVDRFFFGRQTLPPQDEQLQVIRDDIRWLKESHLEGIDAVIDLAAISNDPSGELAPEKTWEINHQGRVRIAQLSKKLGVSKYIFPSSLSIYGFQKGLVDEGSPVNPLTTYSKANLQAERDILPLAEERFCVVVLRQATVYGLSPRMRLDLAINGMVKGLFKNGILPILRDGTQWRPFVHVRDTSRAMMMMLEAPPRLVNAQIFNVGSDEQNYQIMPLAEMVARAIGVPFKYEWYGLPDNRSYKVSFQKIREVLGFRAGHTPDQGAREVRQAMQNGTLDPDDPKTITVQWYKHLLETDELQEHIKIQGVLL